MAVTRSKNAIEDPPRVSSSEETSSEHEETQTQKNPTLKGKHISKKPENSETKEPTSKLLKASSSSSAKRQLDYKREPKEVKKSKKNAAGNEGSGSAAAATVTVAGDEQVKKTGEDAKKQRFQRLFTEDDEIAGLKGMLDYLSEKGTDSFANKISFHEFVKKSIHTDVSKDQLMDKMRRLRKRFENNAGKAKVGEERTFSNAHEQKIYDLSKQIWGQEGIAGKVVKSNEKVKGNGKPLAASKAEFLSSPEKKVDGEKKPKEVDNKGFKTARLFDKRFGVARLEDEALMLRLLDIVGGEKRVALEEKLRALQVAEMELLLQRHQWLTDQVKFIMNLYESKNA